MIFSCYYTQQCFAVTKFFTSWSYCFDRSSAVIHSSMTELQVVDNTRKTEKEMRLSHHYDEYGGHQHDRELSSSLLSYLVRDIVDRIDPGYIKGGSLSYA